MRLLLITLVAALATSSIHAQNYNSGGFESPRFAPGNLEGQDGWLKATSGSSTAVVQTAVDNGGTQAVRVDRAANVNGDARWAVPTPFTPASGDILRVTFDLNVLQSSVPSGSFGPGFGLELYGRSASNALLLLGSIFVDAKTGDVLYQTSGSGSLAESGTIVAFNTFNTLAISANFAALTYTIFVNGVPVRTEGFVDSGFASFSDADIATVAVAGDNPSLNAAGTAYYDNYRIDVVPEPSSVALCVVGIGALAAARLKRRKRA